MSYNQYEYKDQYKEVRYELSLYTFGWSADRVLYDHSVRQNYQVTADHYIIPRYIEIL